MSLMQISAYPDNLKKNKKRVIFSRDIKLFSLLCSCGLELNQMKSFCDERVISLIINDMQNNGELFDTVCSYNDCCRSISEVSKCMYVHANTVFYRLNRLKNFDLDVNDPNDMENIMLTRCLIDYIRMSEPKFPLQGLLKENEK